MNEKTYRILVTGLIVLVIALIGATTYTILYSRSTTTVTETITQTITMPTTITVTTNPQVQRQWWTNTSSGGFGELSSNISNISNKFVEVAKLILKVQKKVENLYAFPIYGLRIVAPTVTSPTVAPITPLPSMETGAIMVPEYSTTNVQVAGVDEHDIVKTNGTHIFIASRESVYIVKAYPVEDMEKKAIINVSAVINNVTGPIEVKITYGDTTVPVVKEYLRVNVAGLYLYNDRIVVLAETSYSRSYMFYEGELVNETSIPPYILYPTTWILVYDASGKLVDYAWITGNLVDSRLSKGKLVVVSREGLYYMIPRIPVESKVKPEQLLPKAYTSWGPIPLNSTAIIGLPTEQATNVMLLNLDNGKRSAVSIMGSQANFIYMTVEGDVYILLDAYWYRILPVIEEVTERIENASSTKEIAKILGNTTLPKPSEYGETIIVYVSTKNSNLRVESYNILEGMATTQFAVDVYNGTLRIALQRGWNHGFNLYTLNATTLEVIGKLEGVADGERVYGIRFMGPRLYIVTYRTVDPLFVIDLSNPRKPEILGYRKGPGFDQYLHPWNETILIGLGYTDERKLRVTTYKINPDASIEQISQIVIDDWWTPVFTSPGGHHAFLLDRKHNLILFPGTTGRFYVTEDGVEKIIQKGGVHVITIDPKTMKLGYKTYLEHPGALRQIYIDDVIYTISPDEVKAYQLPQLRQVNQVTLEQQPSK